MSDTDIVLVDGVRTPFVKSGTDAKELPAQELGRQVLQALFKKVAIKPTDVDEFIFGCVAQPHDAANVTRVAPGDPCPYHPSQLCQFNAVGHRGHASDPGRGSRADRRRRHGIFEQCGDPVQPEGREVF